MQSNINRIALNVISTKEVKHEHAVVEEKDSNMIETSKCPLGHSFLLCPTDSYHINSNFTNQESTQVTDEITMATVCHTILF